MRLPRDHSWQTTRSRPVKCDIKRPAAVTGSITASEQLRSQAVPTNMRDQLIAANQNAAGYGIECR